MSFDVAAYQKEYRAENKERIREQQKARYAATKEGRAEYQRQYHLANKAKRNAESRAYRLANLEVSKERSKAHYRANVDKVRAYKASPEARRRHVLYSAKKRARAAGLPFNLVLADIVIPDRCPCLGIKLQWGVGEGSDNSPSIDRLVPHLGYVKGNISIISWRANKIKTDATAEEILRVAIWLKNQSCQPARASLLLPSTDTAVFPAAQT